MKVFVDTNVLIDFIAHRADFFQEASNLINLGIKGEIHLYATPLSFATCVFIGRKVLGYDSVIKTMQMLESYINISDMNSTQCHNALFSKMPDFEDMLQYESACEAGCDVIVTRNAKHFPKDTIQVLTPKEFFEHY